MKAILALLLLTASAALGQTPPTLLNSDGTGMNNPTFRNAVLPVQTSQGGKYLKTDGSSATWESVTGATVDNSAVNAAIATAPATTRSSLGLGTAATTAAADYVAKSTAKQFFPEDYGAVGDTREVNGTVSITNGSAAITVTGGSFTAGDVGKLCAVPGAGSAAGYLYTTISAYTSASQVTLAASASTTVSAVATSVNVATDDRVALQATITAAEAAGGGTIKLSRCYSITGITSTHATMAGLIVRKGWLKFEGITDGNSFPKDFLQNKDVPQSGLRLVTPNMIGIYAIGTAGESMHGLTFRDFTIQGDYDTAYLFQGKRGLVAFPSAEGAKYPDCLLFDRMNFQWLNECVYLSACDSPTITNSRVCDSNKGITMSGCIGAMISHNVIWDEIEYGVQVSGSTTSYNSPIITGNAFGRSGWDIIISGTDVNPTITGNGFRGGSPSPIGIQYGAIQITSTNPLATSTISGNTFSSTGYGTDVVASMGYRTATIDIATGVKNVAITANSFNLISTTVPAVKVAGGSGIGLVGNNFTMATRLPATFDAASVRSKIEGNTHSGVLSNLGTAADTPVQGPQVFADATLISRNLPAYADNAAALTADAPIGAWYRTATGELRVVYDTDADEVSDYVRLLTSYGVQVTAAQRTLLDNFVTAEKSASRWTSHKRIHIFGWGNAQANALDLKTGKAGNFVGGVTQTLSLGYSASTNDTLTTLSAHGYAAGDPVRVTTTGTIPGGLAVNTTYYATAPSGTTLKLAATYADAIAGTPVIDITSTGTGSNANFIYEMQPGYAYGDGTTGFFDLGINAYRDFGTTSQALGALVYIKHTAGDASLISGGGGAASSLQLLDISGNVGWYPAGSTNQTRVDTGGIYLGSRTAGSSKLHLRNNAGFTSSAAGAPIAPTPSLDESNMNVWRRSVPDFYNNARIGLVYAGLYLDDTAATAFTTNIKTLWEGLFNLAIP